MRSFPQLLESVQSLHREIREILPLPPTGPGMPTRSFDLGLITSTDDEFDALAEHLTDIAPYDNDQDETSTYYAATIPGKSGKLEAILPYPLEMGMAASACATAQLILKFRPRYVFLVGTAAGNKNVTELGDILIAERSINYDEVVAIERKDGTKRAKFMQNGQGINPGLKTKLKLFSRSAIITEIGDRYPEKAKFAQDLKCERGMLVSGSSLVRSQSKVDELVQDYHRVVGLDMETNGFYYAAEHTLHSNPPQFAAIKSVSDFGDGTEHSVPLLDRRKYALYTSSRALVEFISRYI